MIQKLPHLLWGGFLVLCCLCLLSACFSDEAYSTSASDRLYFSADSVKLDTVISGKATNTYTFEVYNRTDKAIRLPSVYLEKGASSGFRVNVDGVFLENGQTTDLEVGAKDSLRVFLFANLPEHDSDKPIEATDRLVFVTEGGVRQEVVLHAWGQDVIPLSAHRIKADTLLAARRPYVIIDSLVVGAGATLSLAAGVRLYFHPQADLIVHGTLVAQGTADSPVVMRGDRLGYMFSSQPYDRIPGQWGSVIFTQESYGNRLMHCDIHSGTDGVRCDSSDIGREKLRIENSIIHNMGGNVLTVRSANIFAGNCQLTNAAGNCVVLYGGKSSFIHCTIGNFYAFSGGRGAALAYSNYEGEVRRPLEAATFINCLITGYSEDEIMGNRSERYADDAFNFSFKNCLLDTPPTDDDHIQNCLWDNSEDGQGTERENNFSPKFDLNALIFTFGLDAKSQAVDHADAATSRDYYPRDLNGRDRLADEGPDIGCYELDKTVQHEPSNHQSTITNKQQHAHSSK